MKYLALTTFIVLSVVSVIDAKSLPEFIKPCRRSDPKLDECALENANLAIPFLTNGFKPLKVPNVTPLKIKEVILDNSGLKMKLRDIVVYGIQNVKITELHMDTKAYEWTFHGKIPWVNFNVKYELEGRILILPIKGVGPGNITFNDIDFTYKFSYELFDKEGVTYGRAISDDINFTTGKNTFQLDNLFNGDERLGIEMNKFLNENPDEVTKIVEPAVSGTIRKIIYTVADSVLQSTPYDEVLLP